jgi:hypothetical protein
VRATGRVPHQRDHPLCLEHPGDHAAAACGAYAASRIVWRPQFVAAAATRGSCSRLPMLCGPRGFQSDGSFTNSSRRCRICF